MLEVSSVEAPHNLPSVVSPLPFSPTGQDSSVSIGSRYGLGRSGDRMPVGAVFSAPVQTGPGVRPASYTMGTGFFPGVKRPGRVVDHPPASSAEVKK